MPPPIGLYDPANEHDACGLGFITRLRHPASHEIAAKGLEILTRLAHRGAAGSDPDTGDGAGILTDLPHDLFARALESQGITLPPPGDYGVGQLFLAQDEGRRRVEREIVEETIRHHKQEVLAWRVVPMALESVGPIARACAPHVMQVFVRRTSPKAVFERILFTIRKRVGKRIEEAIPRGEFYAASFSSRTIVYKGLALPERLGRLYPDLLEADYKSTFALVHSRFSTNTFPTWARAHPYRRIAHNGEINTLRGNTNWMSAREAMLASDTFKTDIQDFTPIIRRGGSDSAALDNVVDFLVAGGRSLPHVMMMLVPEAWATQEDMPADKRGFYEFHAGLVEPWDGPAAIVFTDGLHLGATLDRNGLRPAKYVVTKSGYVSVSSELGVLDFDPEDILEKGRLQPGKMILVDLVKGRLVADDEIKTLVASRQPYAEWVADNKVDLDAIPMGIAPEVPDAVRMRRLERAFGYTREDLETILLPMAESGEEPVGSMGNDAPLAVLSERPQVLFRYFKQQFAQVTNPPIDPIRESLVMSLVSCVGGEGNVLAETPRQARMLELAHPILANEDIEKLARNALPDFRTITLSLLYEPREPHGKALERALDLLERAAERAVDDGFGLLILSDRGVDPKRIAIPSLLAVSAVHQALIRKGKRMGAGIVVETAEAREVADIAELVGFGAGAVNPYLALEIVSAFAREGRVRVSEEVARANYVKAVKKGLLKVLSKMGISTLSSYHGAQIFEAVGVDRQVIERYFTGTAAPLGGIGLEEIAKESLARHTTAFAAELGTSETALDDGGLYAYRVGGERHLWSPKTVSLLQRAVRLEEAATYGEYARLVNEQTARPVTLRGLLELVPLPEGPVPFEEVEPAQTIVKRFVTGAMSFGSISKEAHENLAIAMNRIGGKSNTGEGGEDPKRYVLDANGDSRRSAIKQVASGRFGVTAHYLVSADELQIKIAQGAKPGEGGQLPGHKVDDVIARVRHSTPGVTLISPPPHHDIYSIEDLAQLIFDLRAVNPRARVSVKLVSESGVGTIAAGVAKANADGITIAGHDGGTGAAPLSSIQHAGTPWELGLSETQQVLRLNGLRGRVRVQVDGQLKTGRDVAFAALFGADEFGFATAPLVASGCIMMRKCHLNTCPVGVATQDPVLRARFKGTPEHVIRYFFFVAEELRGIMAELGFRTMDDMIGRIDRVRRRHDIEHPKARLLDFSRILQDVGEGPRRFHGRETSARTEDALEARVLAAARASVYDGVPTKQRVVLRNVHRAFGARLSGSIAERWGEAGLPDGFVTIQAEGTAGQSFGAFLARGVKLALEGDANDYVGKGLSGGILVVAPSPRLTVPPRDLVIVGNTVLYGATRGSAFFGGRAGERFAVRNSGATAVVEGVGDHGCEYMTGGVVVVLGPIGRNFGAGMSGGVAYLLGRPADVRSRLNSEMIRAMELGRADDSPLRALVEAHLAHTKSALAEELLRAWDPERFTKVVPMAPSATMKMSEPKRHESTTVEGPP